MSIENVKKLENAVSKLCHWDEFMSNEDNQKIVNEGGDTLSELAATKDMDVLERMLDYLIEEKTNIALYSGVGENLINDIWDNFEVEQIIDVLYKKFGALIANNEMRAVQFSGYCLNCDCFEQFRDIFNKTKSPNSEKFLDEFTEWYKEDYPEEISILRDDMKKW